MKKLLLFVAIAAMFTACKKDDDDDNTGTTTQTDRVSATVDGQSFSLTSLISSASSGGTTQINAVDASDKGFRMFFPDNTTVGTHDLDTSSIGITYDDDWSTFGNYIVINGSMTITTFAAWPAVVDGTFEGWAINNLDPLDSIYIDNGVIDVDQN